jgi:hypothetical protein
MRRPSPVIDRHGTSGLAPLTFALAAIVVARALVAWAHESIAHRAATGVKAELRGRLVRRAADDAAIPGEGGPQRAEVSTLALTGLDALDGYYARYLPQLVLAGTVPDVVLLALAVTDLTATTIVVLTLPLIPVFMVLVGRATEAANASRWDALTRLSHHFLDVIEGMPTLRAFGRGRAQAERVRATTDRYRATTMATLRIAFLSSFVLELLATLSVALVRRQRRPAAGRWWPHTAGRPAGDPAAPEACRCARWACTTTPAPAWLPPMPVFAVLDRPSREPVLLTAPARRAAAGSATARCHRTPSRPDAARTRSSQCDHSLGRSARHRRAQRRGQEHPAGHARGSARSG